MLTDHAVFVAQLPAKEVPQINRAFDEGKQPQDVLAKYRRIKLDRVEAYEYQHASLSSLAYLTLVHTRKGAQQKTMIAFPRMVDRDTFKVELQARLANRLGTWHATEKLQHPALIALKYAGIVAGIALATALFAWVYMKGDGHWFMTTLIILAGTVVCMFGIGLGHREFRMPPLTVTYEPYETEELPGIAKAEPEPDAEAE